MRRRNIGRQKPWNKPKTEDKFWSFPNGAEYSGAPYTPYSGFLPQIAAGTTTPAVVAVYKASALMGSNSTVTDGRDRQTCKIHRFDGSLFCWLNPQRSQDGFFAPTTATDPANPEIAPGADGGGLPQEPGIPSNMAMLSYWWFKIKNTAQLIVVMSAPDATEFDPNPFADWKNIMLRRDVMKWGTVMVQGIVPRMFTAAGAVGPTGTKGAMQVAQPGMWIGSPNLARIPFPRLPKVGLNLKEEEALVCVANVWQGPFIPGGSTIDDAQNMNTIQFYNLSRVLCSG